MALPEDPAQLNLDAWGLKRLMTLQIRRWISGAVHPKETSFGFRFLILFLHIFCFWLKRPTCLKKLALKGKTV